MAHTGVRVGAGRPVTCSDICSRWLIGVLTGGTVRALPAYVGNEDGARPPRCWERRDPVMGPGEEPNAQRLSWVAEPQFLLSSPHKRPDPGHQDDSIALRTRCVEPSIRFRRTGVRCGQ